MFAELDKLFEVSQFTLKATTCNMLDSVAELRGFPDGSFVAFHHDNNTN